MKGRIMPITFISKPARVLFLSLCVAALGAPSAVALDFNDVRNLIKNQVAENTIISVAQQDPNLSITSAQADELRGMGASENLVRSLRQTASYPADAGASVGYPVNGSPAYVLQDGSVATDEYDYYDQASAPQSATLPQTTVPYSTTTTYPSTSTTYVDPDVVYYDPSTPVVINSPPVVVYETPTVVAAPTYVYPRSSSWGFSVGFGSGWGHRPRYYRDHRPYRRPPPYYGHRPRSRR